MGRSVERVIYTTDAVQPADARPFRRLSAGDLPEGAAEVEIRVFPSRPPHRLAFAPGMWVALRREIPKADLVTIHSLNLFPQYAAFTAAVRAGVPYIVTPHGALDPWLAPNSRFAKSVTYGVWQRRMLAKAAAIHFTTEEEGRLAGGLPPTVRRFIIPNGVDFSRFATANSHRSFRTERLGGYRGPVVLFLGRIAKKKGIDLLIRAFAQATPDRDGMLVVSGPDDEALTPELMATATEAGVADRVRFVGPAYGDDQLSALAAADIWALTSHTENFGNAVVEAMAAGCPVLVSTEVNLAGEIARWEGGVVTPLSVEAIATGLSSLLRQPRRRALLADRGRAFARRFDWSLIAPQLVEKFREVAAGREPGANLTG